ncbi:hypothetical protein V500_03461, partial [Pseudogymnoascus sp. VKM F-4518 (FW-2643)]
TPGPSRSPNPLHPPPNRHQLGIRHPTTTDRHLTIDPESRAPTPTHGGELDIRKRGGPDTVFIAAGGGARSERHDAVLEKAAQEAEGSGGTTDGEDQAGPRESHCGVVVVVVVSRTGGRTKGLRSVKIQENRPKQKKKPEASYLAVDPKDRDGDSRRRWNKKKSPATVTTAIDEKGRSTWEKELDADMAKELKFIDGTHDHGSNGRARSIWEKELRTLAVETRRQEVAKAESPAEAALHLRRSQQQPQWKPQCWRA